jgi:hypothetical protein
LFFLYYVLTNSSDPVERKNSPTHSNTASNNMKLVIPFASQSPPPPPTPEYMNLVMFKEPFYYCFTYPGTSLFFGWLDIAI